MRLKARLKAIEAKLNPPTIKQPVIIISSAFIKGEEKRLVGCRYRDEFIERLDNESEDDFYRRVKSEVKQKQQPSLSVDLIVSIYESDWCQTSAWSQNYDLDAHDTANKLK